MSKKLRTWGKGNVARQAREFGTTASINTSTTHAPVLSPEAKQDNEKRLEMMFDIYDIEDKLAKHLPRLDYKLYENRAYGDRGMNPRHVILAEALRTLAELNLPEPDEDEDYRSMQEVVGID